MPDANLPQPKHPLIVDNHDDPLLTKQWICIDLGGICDATLWNWINDPAIAYPPAAMRIRGRDYWRRSEHRAFRERHEKRTREEWEGLGLPTAA